MTAYTSPTGALASELASHTYHERIVRLMESPPPHDTEWLVAALQSAVSVEFSTIPPYLCALWSIQDPLDPVAASIRNVVQEEMLHMALACNMLTAIGGTPQIDNPLMLPTYPGPIPGAVHPELCVPLSGLSDASLDVFIAIESPTTEAERGDGDERGFKTIGLFYDAILTAFHDLDPPLFADRQVSGPLAYLVVHDTDAIEFAISLIKDQGEGSDTPYVSRTDELAHYYRFREIRVNRRFSGEDDDGQPIFDGPELPRPKAWPMGVVPAGGYRQDDPDVSPEVWQFVDEFDRGFTTVVHRLQAVWEHGDQGALVHAIETMFGLSELAGRLMAIPIPSRPDTTFGPCFRLV